MPLTIFSAFDDTTMDTPARYDNAQGLGFEIGPLIQAGTSAADSWAKIEAARRGPAPIQTFIQNAAAPGQSAPRRRLSPILKWGGLAVGGLALYFGGRMLLRRSRRR